MRYSTFTTSILLLGAVLLSSAALAQEPKPGRLKVTVSPSEAYTFLDLRAMGPDDQRQPAELKWASVETIDSEITHMSPVPREGQATVSPKQTTTYDLTATGPGGVVNSSTTLDVNPTVVAQLEASPAEVCYRRIGGSEAKAASVHLTGSIEPIPTVLLKSIYFPTDYPDKADPSLGLLQSQQDELGTLAAGFTKYLEYDPDAKLSITGYADERGPNSHNQPLSERRAQRVKEFLVSKGVAEEKMEVMAVGDTQQLDKQAVDQLQKDNPNPPPEAHVKNPQATWLAYNRRVDIILMPKNEASVRFYPNQAPDSNILWQKPKPDPKIVAQNQ